MCILSFIEGLEGWSNKSLYLSGSIWTKYNKSKYNTTIQSHSAKANVFNAYTNELKLHFKDKLQVTLEH